VVCQHMLDKRVGMQKWIRYVTCLKAVPMKLFSRDPQIFCICNYAIYFLSYGVEDVFSNRKVSLFKPLLTIHFEHLLTTVTMICI
jgi:hypothetical protein